MPDRTEQIDGMPLGFPYQRIPPAASAPDAAAGALPLHGQTVLITGAASGLGAALARQLAADGANIVVADLQRLAAERVAAALAREGSSAHAIALDVGDSGSAEQAVRHTIASFGRIDVLINNAGTDVTLPVQELSHEAWQRVIATNLNGPFYLSRAAAENMAAHGAGHIINIASTAAKRAWPNASAYHASKWGLLGLSHALHAELRPLGIKVTAVIAGGMRTPFLLDRFPDLDPTALQDPLDVARAIRAVLLMPPESVIAELTVLPMRETSWP
ncbi:MAG: SDR family oxidoreductase [Gammaproteobacteria bacterium]